MGLKRGFHPTQRTQRTQRNERNWQNGRNDRSGKRPPLWLRHLRLLRTFLRALRTLRWMETRLDTTSQLFCYCVQCLFHGSADLLARAGLYSTAAADSHCLSRIVCRWRSPISYQNCPLYCSTRRCMHGPCAVTLASTRCLSIARRRYDTIRYDRWFALENRRLWAR